MKGKTRWMCLMAAGTLLQLTAEPVLRFGVMTDTHVGETEESCGRLRQALELFRDKGVELIVNSGDVADRHFASAYAAYRQVFDETFPEKRPQEIYAYATHDAFAPDFSMPDIPGYFEKMRLALKAPNAHTAAVTVNGCTFLVFPQYTGAKGFLTWEDYERRVAAACRENPGKPVFVIDHVPPAGTVYNSWDWGERHTREILNRYPQVVDISGHVHGSLRNDCLFWQGEFTAVNAGCLLVWHGITVGEEPAPKASYGVLTVDVYADKIVLHRWDVRDGSEIGAAHPWTVPLPYKPESAPWRRTVLKQRETAPQFAAGAKLSAAVEGTPFKGVRLTFPEKVPGAMNFRIVAERKAASGKWRQVARIERIADFWKRPEERTETCEYLFRAAFFESSAAYRLAVSPIGQYGAVGRPLYAEVTTPAAAAFAPTKVVYECAAPMKDLVFRTAEGKRYGADADGFYTTGDITAPCYSGPAGEWSWRTEDRNRLVLPDGVFAGPTGTCYRLTLDLETQQAAEGSAMRIHVQKPDQVWAIGVTSRIRTPTGSSGKTRYVLEFVKDEKNTSDTYHVSFDTGHGRIRFDKIKVEVVK